MITPNLPVTVPPKPEYVRVTNCVSKCRISTSYTNIFTNGSLNNHSTYSLNGTSINFDHLVLYSSTTDTHQTINTININQLSTYYLSEIRVYSPPINTYSNQGNTVDSEIVFIHNLRDTSNIGIDARDEIPKSVVFFIPSNVKINDADKRIYTISSLIDGTTSYETFNLKVNDLLKTKSKFYSYNSVSPITETKSSTPKFISGLSIIFDITPITVLGINTTILSQIKNTIKLNAMKICPTGSFCDIKNMTYAPMGLNPNKNSYYLSCGDVSPQNNNKPPTSSSDLFKKYNITLETVYTMFNILVGVCVMMLILWIVIGIIIGYFSN